MRKLLLNPTPLFRKLRQLSMLLTLLLALPQTAWGEQVTKTYTFTGTTLSGNAGTATSDITGGTVAETYTWNIKDFSRVANGYAYTEGTVTPNNLKLGFSGEGIRRKFENSAYHAVQTTFVLESEAFTGEFVSATIEGYSSTGMSTAKVQVLRDEGTKTSPLSYNTNDNLGLGYTNLSSTTSLPMSTMEVHTSNKYLNGNKLRFIFMFESDNQSDNASFEIGSITITTIPLTPLDINWKLGGSVVTNASVTFGENYSLPRLDVSNGYLGTITYESNNSTVAIVGASGDVTPLTSGETVITATAPATNTFEGGTASYTLTVNKATPTMTFSKRQQTGDNNPGDITSTPVGDNETLTTTCGSTFYAPAPTFSNGHALSDSTRFVYSYSVDGVVVFPNNGEDANNPGKINYGEISLLKAGTVTITCTFPGNMQNNPCSASYKLQVDKGNATFKYQVGTTAVTTSDGYIDVNGVGQWGDPNTGGGSAPALTIPSGATAITYTSSDTNVATVTTTGTVTPVGRGQTTITATMKDDDCYNDATASYELTVKVPATISFANATASVLNPATYTQAATTDPAGSTITYSSSNNDVNVNANGQVTINNQSFYGPVTITATLTAVPAATPQLYYVLANEPAFQATYTLNVAKEFNYVNFASGQSYATCILSEKLTKPDGLKVYYITGTNGNTVTTQEIDYLPDGIPILLEKTAATIGSVTARTDSSSVVSGNLLQYATSDVSATGNQYVLYKNEFVKATGTINRACYLDLNGVAPTRGMYGIGNDGSTAIEGIDVEATKDEEWYDLQGRRIQKPTKAGIYIVNGKKMIINNK